MSIRILLAALTLTATAWAAEPSPEPWKPPAPEKEHEWLHQLAGEWDIEVESNMGPGTPPMKGKGTESAAMLGGFFLLGTGKMDNGPGTTEMHSRLTIGYDSATKKYTGSWVCTADPKLWVYSGKVTGQKLELDATGPSMLEPGKTAEYVDTYEVVDANHKTLTSRMKGADGKWVQFMHARYTRRE